MLVWSLSLDRERMYAAGEFRRQRRVDHAMPLDAALPFEGRRHDMNASRNFLVIVSYVAMDSIKARVRAPSMPSRLRVAVPSYSPIQLFTMSRLEGFGIA